MTNTDIPARSSKEILFSCLSAIFNRIRFVLTKPECILFLGIITVILGIGFIPQKTGASGGGIFGSTVMTLVISACILCAIREGFDCLLFVSSKTRKFVRSSSFGWWFVTIPTVTVFYLAAFFVCNHMWTKDNRMVLILDGVVVTDNEWRCINPYTANTFIAKKDQTVWQETTAITRDGIKLKATIKVTLRLADDPRKLEKIAHLDKLVSEYVDQQFKNTCLALTSSEIAAAGLALEFETVRDGKLQSSLPDSVTLNGLVTVSEIHPYYVE